MKRTNVFLEVDDKVYNTVVEPHKRAKTFSRLIAALLKGYIEDEYVRAYGDEMVDDLRKASVDSLDSALSEMQESLANIGMFTDELQMVNSKGSSFFNKKTTDYQESVKKSEEYVSPVKEDKKESEEDKSLREEMDMLRTQMSQMFEQNIMIMEMLGKSNVQETTTVVDKEEAVVEKTPINIVTEEEELSVFKEEEEKVNIEEPIKEEEQEESKPMFDMGFLSDAAMSF